MSQEEAWTSVDIPQYVHIIGLKKNYIMPFTQVDDIRTLVLIDNNSTDVNVDKMLFTLHNY